MTEEPSTDELTKRIHKEADDQLWEDIIKAWQPFWNMVKEAPGVDSNSIFHYLDGIRHKIREAYQKTRREEAVRRFMTEVRTTSARLEALKAETGS